MPSAVPFFEQFLSVKSNPSLRIPVIPAHISNYGQQFQVMKISQPEMEKFFEWIILWFNILNFMFVLM